MKLSEELRSKPSRDNRALLDRAADRIDELEVALGKQSVGEWIWKSNGYMNALHCSLCNKTAGLHHNFCPNCGAHMSGGKE